MEGPGCPPESSSQINLRATGCGNAVRESGLPIGFLQAIETSVSSQRNFDQKEAAWKQIIDAGQLDQAISELEKRAAYNPRRAEYATTLDR